MKVRLDHRQWEIFTIARLSSVQGLSFAPIGLANMMNSGGSIVSMGSLNTKDDDTIDIELTIRGPGLFLSYTCLRPSKVTLVDGSGVQIESYPFVCSADNKMLEIELPCETKGHHRVIIEWNV
eukprot:scaffold1446_cov191-Alexandrium_tamarense.AAC.2